MTDVIFKYEGTLDKYIGDAIMAVFGAPLDMPDHAARSIKAALEMQERLDEWNAERKEGPAFRIRIGINSGKAVAGEIGSINKKEYTVLGDTVNTASRLESSVAKPGSVVIGANTCALVEGLFECQSLGSFRVKGKALEIPAFEVLSVKGERASLRRPRRVPDAMAEKPPPSSQRRGRILFSILGLLFVVGVLPLLWTSYRLFTTSRDDLEVSLKETQIAKAKTLARQAELYVQERSFADRHDRAHARGRRGPGPVRGARQPAQRAEGARALPGGRRGEASRLPGRRRHRRGRRPRGLDLRDPKLQEQLHEGFTAARRNRHALGAGGLGLAAGAGDRDRRAGEGGGQGARSRARGREPAAGARDDDREQRRLEVYVVDDRGRLVAHSDPAQPLAADLSHVPIVKQFLQGRQRTGGTVNFELDKKAMLGTFIPLTDDTGWGVIVQVDEAKAYRTADTLRNQSFRTVALVTALAVILGTLFAGEISRPIQKLAQGARRLAGGDYATRVSVRSRNEVGVLADAFNQMGEEIQKAIEEIRRRAEVNKELFMGSIRMLANAIDEKDPYTRGHSERVAYYSAVIAKHLGMSPEEVERVHLSGIIHDVGKIGIEDKILRKAAALTDEEYEIMKQHPTKGEHILEAVPLLKEMAGDGLMHHENVDGSGYPRRPQGRRHPAARAHRERGRRLRRDDHRPALLEGDDVRGRAGAAALPGRQEVRRQLRDAMERGAAPRAT